MSLTMSNDNGSEPSLSPLNGPINERKFGDVVLVDHAKDWFLLLSMNFWVDHLLLSCGLQLSVTIVWDESESLLLRFSVDRSEGCWNTA